MRRPSLGREGEARWEDLRAALRLSRRHGEIALVVSDAPVVRDEVRQRIAAMGSRVEVIEPGTKVALAVHEHARSGETGEALPVAWIEARAGAWGADDEQRWRDALVILNLNRDRLEEEGPCHVVLAGPRSLHEMVVQRAKDLASFMSVKLLLGETLEEVTEEAPGLTWVHLSDLHVKVESWQQDHVLEALVRDLPRLVGERELRPDVLLVTGDVANAARRAEYDGAFAALDELCKALGLERRHDVFMVPGNHDVERGRIDLFVQRDHKSLLRLSADELREAVGELQGKASRFVLYGERLTEWCEFTSRFLGRARAVTPDRPWRSDVVEVNGRRLGILSLCTAWTCGEGDAKGRILLGERQLHDVLAEARDGGAELMIALMHHPLHWLHDGEYSAIRGRLEREVDVVLHGHAHDAHSAVQVAAGSTCFGLGAGAAYAGIGKDRYHGFSVGRLDGEAGRLEVHQFTWSTRSGRWCADAGAPGADDRGRVVLPWLRGGQEQQERPKGERGYEVLASRLRHAAARVYATIDLPGLGVGQPRKHALERIFVPLTFRAGKDERVSLEELEARLSFERGGHVVVLGDPGSGKSTLAKHLASSVARREEGVTPILLTVRDWIAEGGREGLLEMAARQATEVLAVRTTAEALEELCARGKVLLIVDGVDEAADPAVRRALRDRVHGFVASLPHVPVLVTSRVAGYRDVPLDDGFEELTLEPFDEDAIEDFVHRWYDLVEDDPVERTRKRVDLLHALEVEPRAKGLARNPLLATLIGMVHFSHAQLPGERAKLYGLIVELLLVTWPAERGRGLTELHGSVQQPMLEKLALRLQERRAEDPLNVIDPRGQVLVGVADLEDMLTELLAEQFPERNPHEQRHLARTWGKWLVDGSGLLQEQQPGQVGFLHLSLMEYLAGRALLAQHLGSGYEAVAEVVAQHHENPVWQESLLLMLGSENKRRALGQAVAERLLRPDDEGEVPWSACVFGLSMLREEVDMGELRERVLEAVCEMAVEVWPGQWREASARLADVLRFGRAHGDATRRWLDRELTEATGERLVGVLALVTGARPWEDVEARLTERPDASAVVPALLDFGPLHPAGVWARARATRQVWLEWARATPLTGSAPRSFEGLVRGEDDEVRAAVWVAPLLVRASWLAETTSAAAQRLQAVSREGDRCGLPAAAVWTAGPAVQAWVRLDTSFFGRHHDRSESSMMPLDFSRDFSRYFSLGFSRDFSRDFSRYFSLGFSRDFSRDFSRYFSLGFSRDFSRDFSRYFSLGFSRDFSRYFSRYFSRDFDDVVVRSSSGHPGSSTAALWDELREARTKDAAAATAATIVLAMIAEAHAGLVIASGLESPEDAAHLATLRVQNRWLNLFSTPLVDHTTRSRPLPENPALHALLLTYGLIQYQTTWQWPDCPHWRAWFSADPPAHWLPAHVWHLVRSIQDPDDPTHRAQATAALERNDWPELARALRENTVVPTPPEVLALFDRGEPREEAPGQG